MITRRIHRSKMNPEGEDEDESEAESNLRFCGVIQEK